MSTEKSNNKKTIIKIVLLLCFLLGYTLGYVWENFIGHKHEPQEERVVLNKRIIIQRESSYFSLLDKDNQLLQKSRFDTVYFNGSRDSLFLLDKNKEPLYRIDDMDNILNMWFEEVRK